MYRGGLLATSCSGDDDDSDKAVSVSLNKTTLSLAAGGEETLTATVSNASDTSVTWSTSDGTVATVADGKVTAVKEGTATITATSKEDSTKKATCAVTVTAASGAPSGGGSGTHEVDITTLTPAAVGISVTAQSKAFEAALGTVTKIGDYFTLGPDGAESKCKWYVRSTTENMNALQLGHSSDYKSAKGTKGAYVEFTVTGTGTFTVSGQSTGENNTSDASLFDSEGNAVPEKNGKTSITGKTVVDLTFENLAAGTYTFSSTGSSSSNLRVTKLKVVEN